MRIKKEELMANTGSGPASQLNVMSDSPLAAGAALPYLDDRLTATENFFIRNHFAVPEVDPNDWKLSISGEVESPLSLSHDQILGMHSKEILNLIECAGNSRSTMQPAAEGVQWDHGAVSSASWRGVPLSAILDRAGISASAKDILFNGADHDGEKHGPGALNYAMSLPMEKALHPDTMLAFEMNGAPLTPEHGFPIRLLVPGWYGMASVKWLTSVKLITKPNGGFHETDYCVYPADGSESHRVTKIQVKSLITSPVLREKVPLGRRKIKGVAWSGEGAIAKVEVSTDDAKTWHSADLGSSDSPYSWQHWHYDWEATRTGHHILRVRATDAKGYLQPMQARWNYRGYEVNSVHTVPVTVESK